MKRTARMVVALAGIGILSMLAFVSLRLAWSDILAYQGRSILKGREQGRTPAEEEWIVAQARLERSLQLSWGDPGTAEALGRLHEARAYSLQEPASKAELRQALAYFRRSALARPTSPYSWANIAFTQSRLGNLDEDFDAAIGNAAALGPWEPEVQIALADIGFRYWNRLPKTTRDVIHQSIFRGLKRQDGRLFELAERYGRLDVMCATPGVARSRRAVRCI